VIPENGCVLRTETTITRRVVLAPLAVARDVLGYVVFPDGRVRVRRRSARRLWRRLAALEAGVAAGRVAWPAARASVASWFGLARHAHVLRLGRAVFTARDVRNVGKRLLVTALARRGPWTMRPPPAAVVAWPCSRAGGG